MSYAYDGDPRRASQSLGDAIRSASRGLIEREFLLELVCLAAVASEHVLVIGPPGTAKSEAVRRVAHALGGSYFEYLLGRFTEPSELFGPVDLRKLREGTLETVTTGMLPEAELVFLDELFLGSTAILNSLLGVLNERVYRRGHATHACKLRVCVAASNALPSDESLAALADRFLIRAYVHPVPDALLEQLLEAGFPGTRAPEGTHDRLGEVDALARAVPQVDLSGARPTLAEALRTLRNAGIALSDRRAVRVQRLIAAAALLRGSSCAGPEDVWPLLYAVPHEAEQRAARELLGDTLARSRNGVLPLAAERASFSRAALAGRLVRDIEEQLSIEHAATSDVERRRQRLRLEALGREIDASFSPSELPEQLRAARLSLVRASG